MCRFIVFYCEREQHEILDRFIGALIESSRDDPYLRMLSKCCSHKHGWGYAIICFEKDLSAIFFGKSLKPIYDDKLADKVIEYLENYEVCLGMIHSRLASRKEPINIHSTQPFYHSLGKHGHLWFIHNGSVYKEKLAKVLNREELLNTYSDSYFASLFIARSFIAKQNIIKAVKDILKHVRTAFNTGIMILDNGKVEILTTNYFTSRIDYFKEYYKLYSISKKKALIVASSTIIDFYLRDERDSAYVFRNGEAHLWEFRRDTRKLVETKISITSHA